MILQSVFQVRFGFFDSKPVVVEPQDGQFTTDAGLLPFRQFDEKLGFTQQFVTALSDPRDPAASTHSFTEMVRVRIFGILADYMDHPCTWRTRMIKVAAEITVSARRIVVRLASSWPCLHHYQHVAQRVLAFCQPPVASTG